MLSTELSTHVSTEAAARVDFSALPKIYLEKITELCAHLDAPGFLGTFTGPQAVGKVALLQAATQWQRTARPDCQWHHLLVSSDAVSCREQIAKALAVDDLPDQLEWQADAVVAYPTVLVIHQANQLLAEDWKTVWAIASESQARGWPWSIILVADQPLMTHALNMMTGPLLSVRITSVVVPPLTQLQSIAYLRRSLLIHRHPKSEDMDWLKKTAQACDGLRSCLDHAVAVVCGQLHEDSLQSPHVLESMWQWFRQKRRPWRYAMLGAMMLLFTGLFWAQAHEIGATHATKNWLTAMRSQTMVLAHHEGQAQHLMHQLYRQPNTIRG